MVIVGAKTVIYNVPKPSADRAPAQSESAYFKWIKTAMPMKKKKWTKPTTNNSSYEDKIDEDSDAPELFSVDREASDFKQIKAATRNFHPDNKIGEGGFGPVYKGVLRNKVAIAVKCLSSKSKQGTREFVAEIGAISGLKHPNLVRLFGCCTENKQLLLVYEYLENNSLAKALFGQSNLKSRLNWETRFKICLGTAKGIAYLHGGSGLQIVHRDIKLTNILLDRYLNPKISDFGLAKIDDEEYTHISTRIAGTIGYMAPEYAMRGYLTPKADVYSFGVVMLEIVSGKSCNYHSPNNDNIFLLDEAYDLQEKGKLIELIDSDMEMMDHSVKEATRVLELAILCTYPSYTLRPTMSEVVSILEGKTQMKSVPLDPFRKANASSADDYFGATLSGSSSSRERNSEKESLVTADNDEGSDIEDGEPTILSAHDHRPSWPWEDEKEKEKNTVILDELDAVNSVSKVNDDQSIGNEVAEGGGKDDAELFIERSSVSVTSESPKSNAKSWTKVGSMNHATKADEDKEKLEYVEPSFDEDGKLHVKCFEEEFETGCNEWKNSLVGCFVGDENPLINTFVNKDNVESLWGVKEEAVSMIPMENGYILFQFKNVEDKIKVLESGPWHFEHIPLVLREWDWKLSYDKAEDEIKTLPIWVKIYNLPLFLWSSSFLSKVASALGTPLYSDQETKRKKRLDYAKLCIEVHASKPLPESMNISVKGINYKIKLKYDWKPLRCATCCTFGHKESICRFKTIEITNQN